MSYTIEKPWGYYTVLLEGQGVLFKKIVIYPNNRLSLQKHQYRDEIWIITNGMGLITTGDKTRRVVAGSWIFIPRNTIHRVGADDTDYVEFYEVQIGDLLSEDDIERFEDDYGRIK